MDDGSTLVTRTDLKGFITYANDDFVRISGYTRDELIGKPHSMIRHPEMPRSAFFDLWNTIQRGKPWNGMVKNRAKNGDHYWVDANVAPLEENGVVSGYMSVRRKPSKDQSDSAESLYKSVRDGHTVFPYSDSSVISIRSRFSLLFGFATILFFLFPVVENYFLPFVGWIYAALSAGLIWITGMWLFHRHVLHPIQKASSIAERIASGDLTVSITHNQNDEVGELYKSLLKMLINTAGLLAQIRQSSDDLQVTVVDLNQANSGMEKSTSEISSRSQSIASMATEMNHTLMLLSSSTEEMSISIGEVARKATDAAEVVKSASSRAAETNDIVALLSESARDISVVIESIASIAAQTNLLALNASIEAAGAGDAGKGFAVVASEVKELARQAAQSSESIKDKIRSIQNNANRSVEAINSIVEVFGNVQTISTAIAAAVEEQSITTKEIAKNISETTIASNEVSKSINEISTSVDGAAKSAKQTASVAITAETTSRRMAEMVRRFRI
jgi:aerotaxis receptor